jgi:hypothetical protein
VGGEQQWRHNRRQKTGAAGYLDKYGGDSAGGVRQKNVRRKTRAKKSVRDICGTAHACIRDGSGG